MATTRPTGMLLASMPSSRSAPACAGGSLLETSSQVCQDFVLKGRFADLVKLDLQALEQEMGFDVETRRPWWHRLIRR